MSITFSVLFPSFGHTKREKYDEKSFLNERYFTAVKEELERAYDNTESVDLEQSIQSLQQAIKSF